MKIQLTYKVKATELARFAYAPGIQLCTSSANSSIGLSGRKRVILNDKPLEMLLISVGEFYEKIQLAQKSVGRLRMSVPCNLEGRLPNCKVFLCKKSANV